jgi:putative hydrolase of the HAD superfamily
MKSIDSVIFDWGGVLIENPAAGLVQHLSAALGVSKKDYSAAYARFGPEFHKGLLGEDEFWRKMCGELNIPGPKMPSLWGQAFKTVYWPREDLFALAGVLHRNGYKTALLSNTEMPAMQFFHQQRYDAFDVLVFSCAERTAKPEREIYELTLKKLRSKPNRAVLIDDNQDYIDGAKAVGINTILFESAEQVKRELSGLRIKID